MVCGSLLRLSHIPSSESSITDQPWSSALPSTIQRNPGGAVNHVKRPYCDTSLCSGGFSVCTDLGRGYLSGLSPAISYTLSASVGLHLREFHCICTGTLQHSTYASTNISRVGNGHCVCSISKPLGVHTSSQLVEWLRLPRFVAVKEEKKILHLTIWPNIISIKGLDKIWKFTSGSLCISKGYVSMWISGNQRLSLYHMAHVAQGAWTLNKSIDHDMEVCSPGWSFFVSSNPQLMKFCVGKCTAVSACPFVTTKEMSGPRLPYKELPMLLRLAPGILYEISLSSAEQETMLCKVLPNCTNIIPWGCYERDK